ncbi:MAG: Ribonuclease P protein component 3 [Candidatus Methanofastidiosum methylothiophilum]|uniref:Ribonuclease P protein component 3 n=1 Tax=Candidatus Methanofastidiosum methylothiophilum TaxID=1705564 RepID=A0A150IIM5_9EURY|nr:MAG: Ribonuclease P protein component 3 [Candidatus Methanofastidiosum methylthiophilus]KYC47007.1 MAG: Ribonuclease P protein component 3 [Candidatus Methanofastidiosum methylthiophilus]KYC49376.1 MAG: Ribonuclease P protein component 3 [Candidatus Methanofastidiosum methylthiophilus]
MGSYYSAIDLRGYPSSYFSKTGLVKQVNIENYKDILESFHNNKKENNLFGIEINEEAKNAKKIIRKAEGIDVIIFKSRDSKENREALKINEITFISNPDNLDSVCFDLARENSIGFELNIQDFINNQRYKRVKTLETYRELLKAYKKFLFPIVLTSGARDVHEIKTPLALVSFGCILGMDIREAKGAITTVPEMLINKNNLDL